MQLDSMSHLLEYILHSPLPWHTDNARPLNMTRFYLSFYYIASQFLWDKGVSKRQSRISEELLEVPAAHDLKNHGNQPFLSLPGKFWPFLLDFPSPRG